MQVNVVSFQLKELFDKSQSVLVVLGDNVDNDLACLAASLVEIFGAYKKQSLLLTNREKSSWLQAKSQFQKMCSKIKESLLTLGGLVYNFFYDWHYYHASDWDLVRIFYILFYSRNLCPIDSVF